MLGSEQRPAWFAIHLYGNPLLRMVYREHGIRRARANREFLGVYALNPCGQSLTTMSDVSVPIFGGAGSSPIASSSVLAYSGTATWP